MNTNQQNKIRELRMLGETYSAIAANVDLSENTVKSFCRRNNIAENIDICPVCSHALTHIHGKRKKRFCSDKCRMEWWRTHQDKLNKKAVYAFLCQNCGKAFNAYGNSKRKYCSRACYGASRGICNE